MLFLSEFPTYIEYYIAIDGDNEFRDAIAPKAQNQRRIIEWNG